MVKQSAKIADIMHNNNTFESATKTATKNTNNEIAFIWRTMIHHHLWDYALRCTHMHQIPFFQQTIKQSSFFLLIYSKTYLFLCFLLPFSVFIMCVQADLPIILCSPIVHTFLIFGCGASHSARSLSRERKTQNENKNKQQQQEK